MPSLATVENFQSFTMICRQPFVASLICLRATIFQNPEGTLWSHFIIDLLPKYAAIISSCEGFEVLTTVVMKSYVLGYNAV
jgi:hypothetical protein